MLSMSDERYSSDPIPETELEENIDPVLELALLEVKLDQLAMERMEGEGGLSPEEEQVS